MDKREIKLKTAAVMDAMRKPVVTCSGIYILLSFLLSFLVTKLYRFDEFADGLANYYTQYMAGNTPYLPEVPYVAPAAYVLIIVISILMTLLSVGFTGTFLKASRGEEFSARDLLDGFEFFFKALFLQFIRSVLIFIGLLFFIVPGVLIFYRYSLAVFVLYDNPDKGVIWCLRESNRLVTGHKKELFSLHVSFIPLLLLCELVSYLLAPILDIWAQPFIGISCAIFYDGLLPHTEPAEDAVPIE